MSSLAFLDTAYFDDVCREKEQYGSRAIELVAEVRDIIVGLIDVECERKPGTVCSKREGVATRWPAGMIWHLAVHPDYRRHGIGSALLAAATERAQEWGVKRFEAWTRPYYHVYMECGREIAEVIAWGIPGLQTLSVFAQYIGDDAT